MKQSNVDMEIPIYNSLCSCGSCASLWAFLSNFQGRKENIHILEENPAKPQPTFTKYFTQLASEMFAQLFASICFS